MATEKDDSSGKGTYLVDAMKVIILVLFFFLIPFAVARNTFGFADTLSGLPGISKGGGIVSGLAAAVFFFGAAGVVVGGGVVATSGSLPVVDGTPAEAPVEPTATQPATPTATSTPETSPTPEPTPTPTLTPDPNSLEAFEQDYREYLAYTLENETLTDVPVLGTEYRENDRDQTVLWVVFWECDEANPLGTQRVTVANGFVDTVGNHQGETPDRLRVYGVTNLANYNDTITSIETSEARAAWDRNISEDTYTNTWWDRIDEPSQAENETAYEIAVEDSDQERADRAFYDDQVEVSGCPGNAEAGTGVGSSDDNN